MASRPFLASTLCAGLLAGTPPLALADSAGTTLPFKASASVTEWLDPSPTNACAGEAPAYGSAALGSSSGNGLSSVIGSFSFTAQDCVTSTSPYFLPPYAFKSREFVITTASGEQIQGRYEGTSTPLVPGQLGLNGSFTITGGTGRFAYASGGGTLELIEDISAMPAKGFLQLNGRISRPR
ncbi:hypothetical protein [Azohydromonas caseinilytica]|uniref:Uncharacterized protein n=1 Tax=Azohydromonas caseinilytica TaxID=2728836 RepID=A0A848F764_9BURK|nr:hypothetical protein [Azohydromonas caseinilytica]NML14555.1 hypothetical protein [Azohydromonas caseinilytica]